jgi:hypothetical protein
MNVHSKSARPAPESACGATRAWGRGERERERARWTGGGGAHDAVAEREEAVGFALGAAEERLERALDHLWG